MADGTYLNLAEAVEQALRSGGPELLSNPRRLLAYLADALDPNGPELRVLIRCCDEGMLAPFAQADRMGPSDLQMTASRLQGYLTDECMVNEATASKVAGSFVVGVARWRGFAAAPRAARGADAHASLELTAEQARVGGTFTAQRRSADGSGSAVAVKVPAGARDGLVIRVPRQGEPGTGGGPSGDLVVTVHVAAGTGHTSAGPVRGADAHASLELTAEQARVGGTFTAQRRSADGSGSAVAVKVPAGARDGLVIRVPRQGEPGTGGGPSGDLVVTLRMAARPVRGADAYASLELTAEQAKMGGMFEARWQVADGQVRTAPVQVPAGAANGAQVRVAGLGEPGTGGGPSGDLVVTLRMTAPAPQPKKFPVWIAAIVALAVVGGLILLHPWDGGGSGGAGGKGAVSQGEEDSGVWLWASSETVEKDGSVSDRRANKYDAHGNTVSRTSEWTYDDGETIASDVTYGEYDEYGRTRSQHQTSKGNDYSSTYDYSFDYEVADDGRLLSSTEKYTSHYESGSGDDAWSSDDSWTTVRTYEYEGDELVSSDNVWSDEDGVKSETHIEYDEFGSQTSYHDVYHSDSFGDWVTDTTYEYERAADGTVLHEWQTNKSVDNDGTTVETWELVYDKQGNLTKSVHTEANGTVTTEEFESTLDDNGNVVERRNLTTGAVTTYKYIYIEDPSPCVKGDLKR